MKRISLVATLFLITTCHAFAQKGFLRGKVIDGENGEGLFAANVVKQGTTTGVTSDFDGNYSLALEPGTYTIEFTYISYRSQIISEVVINSGEVTSLDITLQTDTKQLEEVVVTAEQVKVRNTEQGVLTLQKQSSNTLDAISSQSFKKIGDTNIAGAMKRVTGVTVQDGKNVFVRGLGDRYTKTTLNGMDIPGLDPDKNSVQMDIFPTSIIDNVVVYKTFSPNLPADFTGGSVNVQTKDFPDAKTIKASIGLSHTPGMTLSNNYIGYDGSSTDFLGFDDGTRKLPISPSLQIPTTGADAAENGQITNSFTRNLAAQKRNSLLNSSFSFSAGNQINKEKVTFGYNFVMNYSNRYFYNENFQQKRVRRAAGSFDRLVVDDVQSGELATQNVLWSTLATGAVKFDNHSFSLNLLRLQNGLVQTADQTLKTEQNASTLFGDILAYSQRSMNNITLKGKHRFNNLEMEWTNSISLSKLDDPDYKTSVISRDGNGFKFDIGEGSSFDRFWRELDEFNESFKLGFTVPQERGKIKFGAIGTFKNREFTTRNYTFRPVDGLIQAQDDITLLLQEDNIISANADGTTSQGPGDNNDDYEGRQMVFGGYLMHEYSITSRFKAIYGLRVEKTDMFYTGSVFNRERLIQEDIIDQKTLDELNFFPSLNLVYNLTEQVNLRGNFNQTVARPSFREKSNVSINDPITGNIFIGNLDLEQTNINNYDLRVEYIKGNSLFSISGFYKTFDGHIEITANPVQVNEFKPRNSGDSYLFGIELEAKRDLGFVDPRFKNFAVGGNLSLIESRVDTKSVLVENNGRTEFDVRNETSAEGETIDRFRPMAGQSPYAVNSFINYSNPDKGVNLNLSYNVQGPSILFVSTDRIPDVFTAPFHSLNFNGSMTIGRKDKSSIGIKVQNILNDDRETYYEALDQREIFNIYQPNRTFSVKYGYSF